MELEIKRTWEQGRTGIKIGMGNENGMETPMEIGWIGNQNLEIEIKIQMGIILELTIKNEMETEKG